MKSQWVKDLTAFVNPTNIKIDEPLNKYTMTKLGGPADVFIMAETEQQAADVVKYARKNSVPLFLLGNGSNMVIRDGGMRGIVLNLSKLDQIHIEGTTVTVQSGALIIDVSKAAAAESLTGLEFSCGIPGSVGGAMAMNAGAYGGEIKDVIETCKILTHDGDIVVLSKEELQLGYRKSIIQEKGLYVLSSVFQLKVGNKGEIDTIIADLTEKRTSRQPLEYPSAGSVFKRPPGLFAGKLIQDSGLQGQGVGGAEVSTKHAGFIINKNNATATDYVETIRMVQRVVKEKFGVDLETEVRIVGDDVVPAK